MTAKQHCAESALRQPDRGAVIRQGGIDLTGLACLFDGGWRHVDSSRQAPSVATASAPVRPSEKKLR
jgi:hypothetical protein